METVIVILKNAKAKKLLESLAELDLIALHTEMPLLRKAESTGGLNLLQKPKSPMSEEEIDQQLEGLRNEWERNI